MYPDRTAAGCLAVRGVVRYCQGRGSWRAHNSAVECVLHTDEVGGPNPSAPTDIIGLFGRAYSVASRRDTSERSVAVLAHEPSRDLARSRPSVHLVKVARGHDDGRDVEPVDGLSGGERVMVNPGADVGDGMLVNA
jgi:hypothetical protein